MTEVKKDWAAITEAAFKAALEATAEHLKKNHWYPCGFSWVVIKPARGPIVTYLKQQGVGGTSEYGGYRVFNPSGNATQSMEAKKAGSAAFAAVLVKHGVVAEVHTQID